MFDFLDLILLRRGIPSDDSTLHFRRADGNQKSPIIYFLPWHTPLSWARQAGLIALDYLACYEMPPAIVSSEPELSVKAMLGLVADAESLMARHDESPKDFVVVGLSVGTYPATFLANRTGARLCAVAPADRADLMVWQSPAARLIKRRAIQKGYRLSDYSRAMLGCHPAQNLAGIAAASMFVIGMRDPFVPPRRSAGLLQAIGRHASTARVVGLEAGHLKTLMASGKYQREMLGLAPARSKWHRRVPFEPAFARVSPSGDPAE